MFQRLLTEELRESAAEFPIVTLVGPRQSGKTTLARQTFPDHPYCSLEDPDIRLLAENDPRGFLARYPQGAILDEIQHVPDLLSYLQTRVDQNQRQGEFILTGSNQNALQSGISQSLAGRTAILQLLPLSHAELTSKQPAPELHQLIHQGSFPRLHEHGLRPLGFFRGYYQTYLERDLRQLTRVQDLTTFRRFVKLLAGRVGQIINYTSLGNDAGVSNATARQWLSVLEASFLIFPLPPYYENFSKRTIKSPKFYFTDTGLLCYLLGIETPAQLGRDPLLGAIVENWAVLELLKARWHRGLDANLYFFRDNHGNEVDLLLRRGRDLIPMEIKAGQTFSRSFTKGIDYFRTLAPDRVPEAHLFYAGKSMGQYKDTAIRNLTEIGRLAED